MARPEGFRRRSRISRVAPLGRSDGYCHSRRTTRSAASPTKRAPCRVTQRLPIEPRVKTPMMMDSTSQALGCP